MKNTKPSAFFERLKSDKSFLTKVIIIVVSLLVATAILITVIIVAGNKNSKNNDQNNNNNSQNDDSDENDAGENNGSDNGGTQTGGGQNSGTNDNDVIYNFFDEVIHEAPKNESVGLEYEKSNDGTFYIACGMGGCTDTDLVIPSVYGGLPVKEIEAYAFCNLTNLKSITIPESIERIGAAAFSGCTSIETIYFNAINMEDTSQGLYAGIFNKIGSSGQGARVIVGNKVEKIPSNLFAFSSSNKITSVRFEDGSVCKSIGDMAFFDCNKLASVVVPKNISYIGDDAFALCHMLSEVINHSSLNINADTWPSEHGELESNAIEVHSGKSKLSWKNDYLFYNLNGINYLVGYLGNHTDLSLPESYENSTYEIYKTAFYFRDDIISVVIPDCVTKIGHSSFSSCDSLVSITIGKNVEKIEGTTFADAFRLAEVINHSSLDIRAGSEDNGYVAYHAIEVHSESSKIKNVDDYIFYIADEDKNYLLGYVGYIDYDTSLELPESCNGEKYEINHYAFKYCDNIDSILIPNCVTAIGSGAFDDCDDLEVIFIGNGVTRIENRAFYSCDNLLEVYFEAPSGWSVESDEKTDISSIALSNPETAAQYLKSDYLEYDWKRD